MNGLMLDDFFKEISDIERLNKKIFGDNGG